MKHISKLISIFFLIVVLYGCGSFMHGYTLNQAIGRYMLVDKDSESFGYKRIKYSSSYYAPLRYFVKEKGLPDFIYENSENSRHVIFLFYVGPNMAYEFAEGSWISDSLFQRQQRPITEYEMQSYNHLVYTSKLQKGSHDYE
ncbi:MAG: hypothetical protein C4526_06580 [Nitrospiraceae bacterium]|nr:MAG: hypothetical protein C4526_06580 [Nitrospiraceae bacterium]